MLIRKRMSAKKRAVLIVVLVLCFGAIAYLLFTNFLADKISFLKIGAKPSEEIGIPAVSKLNIILIDDFLTKPPYINLKAAVQLPIKADQVGKANPFQRLPYGLLEL